MNLELIEAFGPIIAALIAVGGSLLIYWLNNRQNIDTRGCLIKGLVTIVVLSALGVAIYFLWPSLEEMAYSLSEDPSPSFTSAVEADYTPIPREELLMEINFAVVDEGVCNNYKPARLGYEGHQYYIVAPPAGYIAICHQDDILAPQGSLQVTAHPQGAPSDYGFGVLYGWKGHDNLTTDSCIVGIRRRSTEDGPITEAIFRERVNGETTSSNQRLGSITLDDNPHTLRVVLLPDGSAQSYLDEQFLAQGQFGNCGQGPIGMVAWSSPEGKVYFDDLKLFK